MPLAKLDRSIFRITGDGAADWLSRLITNNPQGGLTFAALLTPQGKIIADFFVWQDEAIYIETAPKFGPALLKRLKLYRLRAPITIEDVSETIFIYALWDDARGTQDPRRSDIRRLKTAELIDGAANMNAWNAHRLSLGLPDSEWDFESEDTFPHNVNMDRLNGVDFKKGCFIGQEVVSRMQRKTEIRKRLCGFTAHGAAQIQAGDEILSGGRIVGEVAYSHDGQGMAMMRLDRLEETAKLQIGETEISLI